MKTTFRSGHATFVLKDETYLPLAAALVATGYRVARHEAFKLKGYSDTIRLADELRRVGRAVDKTGGPYIGVSVDFRHMVVGVVDGDSLTVTGSFTRPTELLAAVADAETRALAVLVRTYTEQNG